MLYWYYEKFRESLAVPGTRLMVIGYSFGDLHINKLIIDAWRANTLKGMFLVNPVGRDVLNPTLRLPISVHSDLEDIHSLGGSTRTMRSVFGGDVYGHAEITAFFAPSPA